MDLDGTHDVVLCVNVLHAVKDPGSLPHLRSLVAPGGTLIVCDVTQDPNARHPWNTIEGQLDDAFQDARESYEERSQDYAVAADVLKLHLHPLWLKHCYEDVPFTRADFIAEYSAGFPGADFTEVHRVQTGMVWNAPEQHTAP